MVSSKKTKVFFDAMPIALPKISGIGHMIVELVRHLSANKDFTDRYQIILIAPKSGLKYLDQWGFENVEYQALPVKGRIWSGLVLYRLLPWADLFFGKGIYIFGNSTTWPLLFSKAITYIHDLTFLAYPDTMKPKVRAVLKRNVPVWIKRADFIVTISESSKKEIAKTFKVPSDRLDVVYCGVDTTVYKPSASRQVVAIRKKYDVPEHYVLFVSSIEPRKNVMRLLEAYESLPSQILEKYALVLVGGDGWLNERVYQKIDELRDSGLTIIKPEQYVPDEDLPALYSGAAVLLHPAVYEGFGMSPLQALACNTPVIVGDNSSMPEVVGEAGVYVDALSVPDIATKLQQVLENPEKYRQKMSKSRDRQLKLYSWHNSAQKLISVIGRVDDVKG